MPCAQTYATSSFYIHDHVLRSLVSITYARLRKHACDKLVRRVTFDCHDFIFVNPRLVSKGIMQKNECGIIVSMSMTHDMKVDWHRWDV